MQNRRTSYYAAYRAVVAFVACCMFTAGTAWAAGTTAGTTITTTAAVTFVQDGVNHTMTAGSSFIVDRALNVLVTKNSDVNTAPTPSNVALSFLVSNTSNTTLRLALSAVSKATNTWTMSNVRIFRDNNSGSTWDAGDTLYNDASTFGDLASNISITVLIVADTPAGLTINQTALYDLVATAVDAGTLNASAPTTGPDTSGVDTVFLDIAGSAAGDAARDGKHSATGVFSISDSALNVVLNKTVAVLDQWGGSLAIPGATLRYTIAATTTGGGTANNVVVSDPLPVNTTFIANSLRLNNTALTDIADTDAGDFGATTQNTVTVKLGNLTSSSGIQTITFDVKIN
jgi:uncharacterized repeat protein (TIGR01451 family)